MEGQNLHIVMFSRNNVTKTITVHETTGGAKRSIMEHVARDAQNGNFEERVARGWDWYRMEGGRYMVSPTTGARYWIETQPVRR